MKTEKLIASLLLLSSLTLAAVAAPQTEARKDGNYYRKELAILEKALPSNALQAQQTLTEAKARVNRVLDLERTDSSSEEIPDQLKACSLYVEIIRVESQIQTSRNHIAENWEKRMETLRAIEKIQVRIGEERSGKVSTLAADLEAEKARLQQTSAAMTEQQQKLLAEADAREAELKKQLDEERAKAEARQNEAKNRLNELQSKLIQVRQDARGIILSMSDILFDVDKASLKPDLKTSLAKVAGILSVYQELNVSVEGHTDNTGSEDYNMKLSEQRAQNVLDFLVEQGIEANRLTSRGFGMTMPIADNSTKEGRQKNRRVDLVIRDKALQQE